MEKLLQLGLVITAYYVLPFKVVSFALL